MTDEGGPWLGGGGLVLLLTWTGALSRLGNLTGSPEICCSTRPAATRPYRSSSRRIGRIRHLSPRSPAGVDLSGRSSDLYLLHGRGRVTLTGNRRGLRRPAGCRADPLLGVSNLDVDDLIELTAVLGEDQAQTDQVPYNLVRRGLAYTLLPWLSAHGIPVMAYSPIEHDLPRAVDAARGGRRHRHRLTSWPSLQSGSTQRRAQSGVTRRCGRHRRSR